MKPHILKLMYDIYVTTKQSHVAQANNKKHAQKKLMHMVIINLMVTKTLSW